jgi:hypothetical protein
MLSVAKKSPSGHTQQWQRTIGPLPSSKNDMSYLFAINTLIGMADIPP